MFAAVLVREGSKHTNKAASSLFLKLSVAATGCAISTSARFTCLLPRHTIVTQYGRLHNTVAVRSPPDSEEQPFKHLFHPPSTERHDWKSQPSSITRRCWPTRKAPTDCVSVGQVDRQQCQALTAAISESHITSTTCRMDCRVKILGAQICLCEQRATCSRAAAHAYGKI
jgi:hypothetical protein